MQVWCDWQLTLCDPHLSALKVRFHDDALYKSMFTFTFTCFLAGVARATLLLFLVQFGLIAMSIFVVLLFSHCFSNLL